MCTSTLQISNKSIQTKDKMDSRSKCDVIAPFSLKIVKLQLNSNLKFGNVLGLTLKSNKNYFIVRNTGCACSRYTLKLSLIYY